jgi:CRISPR/Cas system type I-B associated protein Csh2 (Cas7 group RAMP superfamily)
MSEIHSFYSWVLNRKAQKEVETTNYTLNDLMNEGKAKSAGFTEEDADSEQLKMGIEIEREHTNNVDVAKKIALDHLAEFFGSQIGYYTALKEMEDKLKSSKQSED